MGRLVRRPRTLWKQLEPHSPLGWLGALVGLWLAVTGLSLILFLASYVPVPKDWNSLLTGGQGWPSALLSVSLLAAWLLSILYAIRLSGRAMIRVLGWWLGKILLFLTERTGNEVLLQLVPSSRVTERELAHHAGIYLPYAGRDPVTLFVRKLGDVLHSLNLTDVVIVSAEYRLSAIELRLLADRHQTERLFVFEKRLIAQLGEGGVLRQVGPDLLLTVWGIDKVSDSATLVGQTCGCAELIPLCLLPARSLRGPAILYVSREALGHALVASQDRRLAGQLLAGLAVRIKDLYPPDTHDAWMIADNDLGISWSQQSYDRRDHPMDRPDLGVRSVSLNEVQLELQERTGGEARHDRPDILLIVREASELDWQDESVSSLTTAGRDCGVYLIAGSTSPEHLDQWCINEFATRLVVNLPDREQRRRLLGPERFNFWVASKGGLAIRSRLLGYLKAKMPPSPSPRLPIPLADAHGTMPDQSKRKVEPEAVAQLVAPSADITEREPVEIVRSDFDPDAHQVAAEQHAEDTELASKQDESTMVPAADTQRIIPISTPYYVRLFGEFSLERTNGELIYQAKRGIIPVELIAYLAAQPDLSENKDILARRIWETDEKTMSQSLTSATNEIKAWFKNAGDSDVTLIKAVGRGPKSPRALDASLVTSDVRHFRQAVGYAEDLIEKQPARAMAALREAVDLYRGDFVPGLTRDWAVEARRRLRAEFIETLEKLIFLCEQSPRCREDVEALRRQLVDARQRQTMR